MDTNKPTEDVSPPPTEAAEQPASWVEIENGRYQPRRTRGSCLGRELG